MKARAGGMLSHRSTLYGTACKNDGVMYKTLLTDGNIPTGVAAQGPESPAP